MKVLFLAPSLAPAKSGVGDYTRSLAEELCRTGHQCLLIALNDDWTNVEHAETTSAIPTLRFPSSLPWKTRFDKVEKTIEDFDPEWISLQFVPYGFQKKGIVWQLLQRLPHLVQGRRLHILFHELWIGCSKGALIRQRLVGTIQRSLILKLAWVVRPCVMHTTNALYRSLLRMNGLTVGRLPLFGSIRIAEDDGGERLMLHLRTAGIKIDAGNRHRYLIGGFFGAIYPGWPSRTFFEKLGKVAEEGHRTLVVISIGRSGVGLWNGLVKHYGRHVNLVRMGEQSPESVSALLRALDFGISSTPSNIIGKSIGVATMFEHGLPVVATWAGAPVPGVQPQLEDEPLFLSNLDQVTAEALKTRRSLPRPRLPDVARQFCSDLGPLAHQSG